MNNFLKLAQGVDVDPLLHQMNLSKNLVNFIALSGAGADPSHPGYSHREAAAIIVRYADIPEDIVTNPESYKRASDDLFAKPKPPWYVLSCLRPLVYQLFAAVGGVHLGGIGIMRLDPGAQIYPHYDTGLMTDFYRRYHIVLAGPYDCWFICGEEDDEERVEQLTGEAWWFDSHKKHAVINQSNEPRISISIDISS